MSLLEPEELRRLLSQGETLDVEFKSDRDLKDGQLVEAAELFRLGLHVDREMTEDP